jgi:hypothetical protein
MNKPVSYEECWAAIIERFEQNIEVVFARIENNIIEEAKRLQDESISQEDDGDAQ